MRSFAELFDLAAERHGGAEALEAQLRRPKSDVELTTVGDDRWLAGMTRAVFNSGFNWKVVENKWDGFEAAFEGFDIHRNAMLSDDDLDRLTRDTRIIRHGAKIRSVRENAGFLVELAAERGDGPHPFVAWPAADFVGLLELLARRGSRLGGNTGQYFLRSMGRDGFILSRDGVMRLIEEEVIERPPTSKSAMRAVQGAYNELMGQSGRSMTEISRVLSLSYGEIHH